MGSFVGYVFLGFFFIVMLVWWIIFIFMWYFKVLKRDIRFKSFVMFLFFCCFGRLWNWLLEVMVKLFMVFVGFLLEIYIGISDGKFIVFGNG